MSTPIPPVQSPSHTGQQQQQAAQAHPQQQQQQQRPSWAPMSPYDAQMRFQRSAVVKVYIGLQNSDRAPMLALKA